MTNYIIPDENIERLEKKILKLQNRSNKNGLEPIIFKKMATFGIFYPNDRGQVREEIYHNVFVEGKPPMLPGFKLIGKLEPSDKGNILSLYDKDFKEFHTKFGERDATCCDHCNTNRKRNYGYVVRNELEDKELIVASSCLENYVIEKDPEQITAFESLERYIQEEHGKRATKADVFMNKMDVLIFTLAKVKSINYNYYHPETVSGVLFDGKAVNFDVTKLLDTSKEDMSLYKLKSFIYENHTTLLDEAKNIIIFAKNEYEKKANNSEEDYKDWNKYLVIHNNEFIKPTEISYFYQIIKEFNKNQLEKNIHLTNHLGEIDKKGQFDVKLVNIEEKSSLYTDGIYYRYDFINSNNDKMVLFSTKIFFEKDKLPNDNIRIEGKIKSHGIFNGEKTTTIKNIKVLGLAKDFTELPISVLEEQKKVKKPLKNNKI